MSSSSPNFPALAAQYLSSNLHRLEQSTGCFVCLLCDIDSWRGTWNPDYLVTHVKTVHQDIESLACVFCGVYSPIENFVSHVVDHLSPNYAQTHVYTCPVQSSKQNSSTPCSFQTNNLQSLRFHVSFAHGSNNIFTCPHCSNQETAFSTWVDHINTHVFRLSHCTVEGCCVKSPSDALIVNHVKRRHGANFSGLIGSTLEFVCSHNGTIPPFLRSTLFSEPVILDDSTPPSPPALSPILVKSSTSVTIPPRRNGQPFLPLCLRCPKCPFSTGNWNRFCSHVPQCCDSHLASCHLYWCSICCTVSTDKGLVEEHVQDEHGSKASVIQETLEKATATMNGALTYETAPVEPPPFGQALVAAVTTASNNTASLTPASDVFSAFSNFLNSSTAVVGQPAGATPSIVPPASPKPENLLFAGNPFLDPQNISAVAAMAAALTGFTMNPPPPNVDAEPLNLEALKTEPNGLDEAPGTPASSGTTATGAGDDSARGGRTGDEEFVSFPFDEVLYRAEMSSQWVPELVDQLAEKMQRFSIYVVKILGKENHRRVPQCPECERVFSYGLPDFKRHLLAIHLGVPREYLKDLLRFARLPKVEVAVAELQEQDSMRRMRPQEIEPGVRKIPLPYSICILRRLIDGLPEDVREQIMVKMRSYCKMSTLFEMKGGVKKYKCCQCSYTSPHALADVRKHILGSHCNISTKHFRFCLQASRLDNVDFCLLSDEKLSRLAQEFATRRQPESAESETSSSTTGVSAKRQFSRSPSPEAKQREPDEDGVSSFTTMVPGSNTPVTVRIKAPVPPDTEGNTPEASPTSPSSSIANSSMPVDLGDIINSPGLESANQILDLPLPYSSKVLRELLDSAGALPHQIEDICAKMKVYSSNPMTRICQGGRTLAFRCSCGRLFITTRQPDSKMRAATLADSRRHVMGVHARIQHEYITICCQASRISRENGFQLYADDMLHRLAMDRPIKLNSPDATALGSNAHRSPSKSASGTKSGLLPPLRPLADISGDTSEDGKRSNKSSRPSGLPKFLPLSSSPSPSATPTTSNEADEVHEVPISEETIDIAVVLSCLNEQNRKDVERIIDLPYSKTALQVLVRGYCPPSYFKILLSKMQVYTAYKVFVTRRRGRRFFCCSGCNSVSPHGMGDIRKHILGVHAKVPERYKAAAMHCSRLSREDNSLLGDRSLLQLAKMKWKGTVIKPLAEISMASLNGSAGGSSSCSAARTAGSSSCKDSLSMAPNPRHFRNSVNRLPDDTPMVAITATPAAGASEDAGAAVYSCSACPVASADCAAMRSHVAREHLGARAYECPACPEAFNMSAGLINHCVAVHLDCTPVIPPLELSPSYRDAMSSIPINHEPDALDPSIVSTRESVAMEDDEMGRLWQILQDEQDDLDQDDSSITIPLHYSLTNGATSPTTATSPAPSSAMFPSLMPLTSHPRLTPSVPSQSTPLNGRPLLLLSNGGSSRRKPSKANLVQFKPKVINGGSVATTSAAAAGAATAEDEVKAKRPRLDEDSSIGAVEQGV